MNLPENVAKVICQKYFDCFKDNLKGEFSIEFNRRDMINRYHFEIEYQDECHDVTLQIEPQSTPNQFEVSIECQTKFSSVECMPITGLEQDFGGGGGALEYAYDYMGNNESVFCWPVTITLSDTIELHVEDKITDWVGVDKERTKKILHWYVKEVIIPIQEDSSLKQRICEIIEGSAPVTVEEVAEWVSETLNEMDEDEPMDSTYFHTVEEFLQLVDKVFDNN